MYRPLIKSYKSASEGRFHLVAGGMAPARGSSMPRAQQLPLLPNYRTDSRRFALQSRSASMSLLNVSHRQAPLLGSNVVWFPETPHATAGPSRARSDSQYLSEGLVGVEFRVVSTDADPAARGYNELEAARTTADLSMKEHNSSERHLMIVDRYTKPERRVKVLSAFWRWHASLLRSQTRVTLRLNLLHRRRRRRLFQAWARWCLRQDMQLPTKRLARNTHGHAVRAHLLRQLRRRSQRRKRMFGWSMWQHWLRERHSMMWYGRILHHLESVMYSRTMLIRITRSVALSWMVWVQRMALLNRPRWHLHRMRLNCGWKGFVSSSCSRASHQAMLSMQQFAEQHSDQRHCKRSLRSWRGNVLYDFMKSARLDRVQRVVRKRLAKPHIALAFAVWRKSSVRQRRCTEVGLRHWLLRKEMAGTEEHAVQAAVTSCILREELRAVEQSAEQQQRAPVQSQPAPVTAPVTAPVAAKQSPTNFTTMKTPQPIPLSRSETQEGFALRQAASQNEAEMVVHNIAMGASVDEEDADGNTALLMAAENGCVEAVKVLLASGANVEHSGLNQWSALGLACEGGHDLVVAQLLKHNANTDKTMEEGITPLMAASENGHLGAVRALLSAGADANRVADDLRSPLMLTCVYGYTEVARALVAARAQPNYVLPDGTGTTALKLARDNGHDELVQILTALSRRYSAGGRSLSEASEMMQADHTANGDADEEDEQRTPNLAVEVPRTPNARPTRLSLRSDEQDKAMRTPPGEASQPASRHASEITRFWRNASSSGRPSVTERALTANSRWRILRNPSWRAQESLAQQHVAAWDGT